MKVSVIIPVYNAEKYLPVCLESLAIQTMQDFEVILVDDCSTDSSIAIAENFLERFGGRLKIFSTPQNTGSGSIPRNIGLEHASGDYVYFVDNDDFLIDNALETLYGLAQEYHADVVYMEKVFDCDEEPVPKKLTIEVWEHTKSFVEEPTLDVVDIAGRVQLFLNASFCWAPWEKFLRRDLLVNNDITFPRMTVFEDVIWTFKLLCAAERWLRIPMPLYVWRNNKKSVFRRTRSPEQTIKFYMSPLIHGLDILDEFTRRIDYFKQNSTERLQVLNFFANIQFYYMKDALNNLDETDAYEIFLREISAAGNSQPALTAYLLLMNNIYRKELIK